MNPARHPGFFAGLLVGILFSGLTWVLWRYDWPFQGGTHTFTVRCYDGVGAPQIETPAPPHPSGASGLHTRSQMF